MSQERTQFGWLDANIFIHPLFENDVQGPRCRAVLDSLLRGTGEGWVDCVTLHELTYALPRALPKMFGRREDLCDYLMGYLTCETVLCEDKGTLIETLRLWATSTARFGDIRLVVLARTKGMPVCTVTQRDFASVANTYPS